MSLILNSIIKTIIYLPLNERMTDLFVRPGTPGTTIWCLATGLARLYMDYLLSHPFSHVRIVWEEQYQQNGCKPELWGSRESHRSCRFWFPWRRRSKRQCQVLDAKRSQVMGLWKQATNTDKELRLAVNFNSVKHGATIFLAISPLVTQVHQKNYNGFNHSLVI